VTPESRKRLLAVALIVLAVIGITARIYTLLRSEDRMCGSDFPVFYAGGQLIGSTQLYSPQAVQAIEQREMGCKSDFAISVRLPFFAVFMKPWSWLPFWPAFWLWRAALVIATGIFIWLWPAPRTWSLVICAWSLPLAYGFNNGQDVAFLLMWLALAVALFRKGWEFAAGCALAMCAAKFHLFLLLPLLLLHRRRLILGWMVNSLTLALISFAAAGMAWTSHYLAAIRYNIDPNPAMLPNLRGIAHFNFPLEVILTIGVLAAAGYVIRFGDFEYGLSAVIVGGLLLSFHLTPSDMALLIPVALSLAGHDRAKFSRIAAVCLASPIGDIIVPGAQVIMLLSLIGLMCYEVGGHADEADCGRQSFVWAQASSTARL
jgi:hypothetical protein